MAARLVVALFRAHLLHRDLPAPDARHGQAHAQPVRVLRHAAQVRKLGGREHAPHVPRALQHLGRAGGEVALLDRTVPNAGERLADDGVGGGEALFLNVTLHQVLERRGDEGRDDDAACGEHGSANKVRRVGEEGDVTLQLERKSHESLRRSVAAQGTALENFLPEARDGHEIVDLDLEEGG